MATGYTTQPYAVSTLADIYAKVNREALRKVNVSMAQDAARESLLAVGVCTYCRRETLDTRRACEGCGSVEFA